MEDERIEAVKNWPEPTSVRDIQVFIGFANFYQRFIQGFSIIATPLTFLLKTTGSSEESASKAFRADGNEVVGGGSGRANETVVNPSKNEKILNFYQRFIRSFSKIAASLTSLLKTIESSKSAPKTFRADDDEVVGGGGGRADEIVMDSFMSKNQKSRKSTRMPNIGAMK